MWVVVARGLPVVDAAEDARGDRRQLGVELRDGVGAIARPWSSMPWVRLLVEDLHDHHAVAHRRHPRSHESFFDGRHDDVEAQSCSSTFSRGP